MKPIRSLVAPALAFALVAAASASSPAQAQTPQWWPVWQESFGYVGSIDPNLWYAELGNNGGWGNNELEDYTSNAANLSTDGSVLHITALNQPYQGFNYTSARIDTTQGWTYGTFTVTAKLPTGRGVWPAIWMMPVNSVYGNHGWPDNGELDIMEEVGYDPSNVYFHTHNSYTGGGGSGAGTSVPTDGTAFHTYRLDWAPDHVAGFVDNVQYYYESRNGADWHSWPFDQPFHFILNDAVGGNWGGIDGIDDSAFPQDFQIQSVDVYKLSSVPYAGWAAEPALPGRLEAENYDIDGEGYAYHSAASTNAGGAYRQDGIGIAATTDPADPGYYVGWMTPDEWLNYTATTPGGGQYDLTFRLATIDSGTSFNCEVDDQRVATVAVPNTGGWDTWQSVTVGGVALGAGNHRFRVLSNSNRWNINYIDVTPHVAVAPGAMRWNPVSHQMAHTVTLTNMSGAAMTGSIAVASDALPAGVSLVGQAGLTTLSTPYGSPFVKVALPAAGLAPGKSVVGALVYADPRHAAIAESLRVLPGAGPY